MKGRLMTLASDSVVYGLSSVLSRFITILLVPIYTRLFTPEDYGVMSLVASSLAIVSIFVGLGLDNSAHRWYWDTEDGIDRRRTIASWAWCQTVVALVFAVAVIAASGWLARHVVERSDSVNYFRVAALSLPLSVLGAVLSNWLRMQRRPWATTIYALGSNLIVIVTTLVLVVLLRWGLIGVYAAQAIGFAIGTVIAAALLRDWIAPRFVSFERLRVMLRYAVPLIPAGVAYWVTSFADRYFVQAYTNTAQVGLYSVGSSLAAGVALLTGAFQQAWGPFALSIHTQADGRQTYASVFVSYLWLTGAVSAALSLFAPEILHVLATKQYVGASSVVGILAMGYVMIGLTYIAATGPSIVKRTGPTGVAMVAAAGLNVLLNYLLVPHFGKVGSAVATLIAQSVTPIYLFWRSQQLYPIPYRFGVGAVIVAATLVIITVGAQLDEGSWWMLIGAKLGLLALFIPLFFMLGLATPGQIGAFIARTTARARGAQA